MKPVLAFTSGDPAGIGPEVIVASVKDARVRRACRPLLIGTRAIFQRYGWTPAVAPIMEIGSRNGVKAGLPSLDSGKISFEAVQLATRLCLRRLAHGMVTGPISKSAWASAGISFKDHTDYLQEAAGVRKVAMMLLSEKLRSVLVTRHVPLRQAPDRARSADVIDAAKFLEKGLGFLGIYRPRLGLCALNPHAGEAGILGWEEKTVLVPSLRQLRRKGMNITGPLPADSAWATHRQGGFDGLVSMYHDQAMIPLKFAAPNGVVNWTLGIPFVRTSPGHGTAFDIAGKGKADPEATVQAAVLAARLASRGSVWAD